jgi:hypothetical protein
MHIARLIAAAFVSLLLTAACVAVTLAPGADKVRITKVASDVSSCTAVGNIKAERNPDGSVGGAQAELELRNQTIGFGGNTVFVTTTTMGMPTDGIAYRCP